MKKFLLRKNCEYTLAITADSDSAAVLVGSATPLASWSQSWSVLEIEEEGPIDDAVEIPDWQDRHSVTCLHCQAEVDERNCLTRPSGEGMICDVCFESAQVVQTADARLFIRQRDGSWSDGEGRCLESLCAFEKDYIIISPSAGLPAIMRQLPIGLSQRQDSVQSQLFDLRQIANRLGFYDAADALAEMCK